jgi:DNA-directed RNA polymerase sigma subunit (sigma70/sigma32)
MPLHMLHTDVATALIQGKSPKLDRHIASAALAALTPREANALRTRFGIDMGTDHTLERGGAYS